MKVIVSAAISLDGYLDDCSDVRLRLSSDEDWDEVSLLRAQCDAILVGAGTLRADNPSLVIKDEKLRQRRVDAGKKPDIIKVTLSDSGHISPDMRFFTEGVGEKVVFLPYDVSSEQLEAVATVVKQEKITARSIVEYLSARGVGKLMVEGGSNILSMFFAEGMADQLRLAIAPFFVGDERAPKFVCHGIYPSNKNNRMKPDRVRMLGDTTVMDFNIRKDNDVKHLLEAINQSRNCIPSMSAYSVGAVIETNVGNVYTGYTHETDPHNHAEEEAIKKALEAGETLRGAAIYCSMEPCSTRKSKPVSCTQLIIEQGFSKVVFAYCEPVNFVVCEGAEMLARAGVDVIIMDEYAHHVKEINGHIINSQTLQFP